MPHDTRTPAQRKRFRRLTRSMLTKLGAKPRELAFYERDGPACNVHEMILDTPAGTLILSPFDSWLAARFVDPRHAYRFVDCNPHSGKWNFHEWQEGEPALAVAAIEGRIKTLIAYGSEPEACAMLLGGSATL